MRLQRTPGMQELSVEKIIPHPKFKTKTVVNDLAIIKVTKRIKIDHKNTDIINLAYARPEVGTSCISMGWGVLYDV